MLKAFYRKRASFKGPLCLLLDIALPGGMSGLEGISHIHERFPDLNIVMLTAKEDSDVIFEALCAGAVAYLSKRASLAEILNCLEVVVAGGSFMSPDIAQKVVRHFQQKPEKRQKKLVELTPRQEEIIREIVAGKSYQQTADELGISLETVRDHIKKIYTRLQVHSKAELIRLKMEGKI